MNLLLKARLHQMNATMRRFVMGTAGCLLIALSGWIALWTGKGNLLWEWTPLSQGLLALQLILWLSVPVDVYREGKGNASYQWKWISLPVVAVLWLTLHQIPFTSYVLLAVPGTLALSLALLFLACEERAGRVALFTSLLFGMLCGIGIGFLAFLLLALCLSGISLLFQIFFPWDWYVWGFYTALFVAGWQAFLSQVPVKGQALHRPAWYENILAKIILPAALVLAAMLYLYLGKSALERQMPVGIMNWYVSWAVAMYALFYFSCCDRNRTWMGRVLQWGCLLLLPVVAVQLWCVKIRLDAYGLTSLRWLSLCCTLFGMCVLLFGITNRKPRGLYALAAVLAVLLTVTPLNVYDFPASFQAERLQSALARTGLLENGILQKGRTIQNEDAEILRSSYRYLVSNPGRWKYPVVKQLQEQNFLAVLPAAASESHKAINYWHKPETIPVAGYSTVSPIQFARVKKSKLLIERKGNKREIDLAPFFQTLQRNYPSGGTLKETDMTYQVDAKTKLLFTQISGPLEAYQGEEEKVVHCTLYLLEK